MALPIYIVIVFWLFLLEGIEKRLEVNVFMNFGLLGLTTLKKETEQLYKNNLVWIGLSSLISTLSGSGAVVGSGSVAVNVAVIVAWTVASAGVAVAWTGVAVAWTGMAEAWTGVAVAGFLSGLGLDLWTRAEKKQDWLKYLAILAFPWFCTFPIVVIFSSLAMYDFLSWQWPQILIAWIIIFSTCTALWQRGQKLDHDARNPLYGILDKQ